jgi:oligoendopeptidase F
MKTRNQIEDKYKLDTKDLFENDQKFLEEIDKLSSSIENVSKYEGHLLDNDQTLLEALQTIEELETKVERCYIYASLNRDFDLANKNSNENYGKAFNLYKKYASLSNYFTPEILKGDYKIVESYIKKNKELKPYEILLKEIFRTKKHTLSKKEEYILTKLSDTFNAPEQAYSKLTDVDLTFGKIKDENGNSVELSESNYPEFIASKNRNVRKQCFKKFYKGYESIINTTSELLAANVKKNNTISELRNYNSALEASLDSNDVSIIVYEKLMNAINNNLDIIHRQWDIRKQTLKVDKLHIYDTYVPLVEKYEKKYSYEEAKNLILSSLEVMGSEYNKILKQLFDKKWIDVMPNKNKRGGAYCTCCYLAHPYVVTNFSERYEDVSTIIHELGHAMHYYYAQKNNNYFNYSYSIFVAEVASQVNEILLALYVLNNTKDKEEKIFILDELIKHFKSSTVRQTMFAEFEKTIHDKEKNGEILTCQNLCDTYYELNKKYYGKKVTVDEEIKYEWSRIPHFYYNFYVYQYSTGYIAALKIANDIYNKKENALDNYIKFLKLGCTIDPVTSLKIAGVDLTKDETYKEAFEEFNNQMDEFEKLVGKE